MLSFRVRARACLAPACLTLAACSSPSGEALTPTPVGDASAAPVATLTFEGDSTLALAAGETKALDVVVAPATMGTKSWQLGFALVGDPGDGALDSATAAPDAHGHATVTLHAPTSASTFGVRAALLEANGEPTGVVADENVTVSEKGFGSVNVVPMYLGHRTTITTWDASVSTVSCATLRRQGAVPAAPAGAPVAQGGVGSSLLVKMVPAGTSLSVAVRAGHFAWGCTDTTAVVDTSPVSVVVDVLDKPLDLADAKLHASLTFTPDAMGYGAVLGDAVAALVDSFMPTSSSEGKIVLNGMAAAAGSEATTFGSYRVEYGWDAVADQHFASLPMGLRDTCSAWATAGVSALPTTLALTLTGQPGGGLTITPTALVGFTASSLGVETKGSASWASQAGDEVLFSGALVWQPSLLAGLSTIGPAQAAVPAAATVAAALGQAADCEGLATALGGFQSCDVACVALLCEAAITSRWTTALGASKVAGATDTLLMLGSGKATVGDVAQPVTLKGQWQGQIVWGAQSTVVDLEGGALSTGP